MIRLDFRDWCKQRGTSPGNCGREDWKVFACQMNAQYPNIMAKKPNGNGTHTDIMGYHIQATGSWSLYIFRNKDLPDGTRMNFAINYSQISFIDVDEDNNLIIINGLMAIK